ncbi:hypothetical protein BJ508DRAFT_333201 [Ascobolus immersus RN42]|uniref:Uncharacterized protein n=1 Tax=Ascobolus immersus RN42 TaxID=1160509 RepID=A0A3N4HKA5_ASCIM|nr:hypothetical protein BJ508DRAFT_333201 [Ascobolus immersus RN42]
MAGAAAKAHHGVEALWEALEDSISDLSSRLLRNLTIDIHNDTTYKHTDIQLRNTQINFTNKLTTTFTRKNESGCRVHQRAWRHPKPNCRLRQRGGHPLNPILAPRPVTAAHRSNDIDYSGDRLQLPYHLLSPRDLRQKSDAVQPGIGSLKGPHPHQPHHQTDQSASSSKTEEDDEVEHHMHMFVTKLSKAAKVSLLVVGGLALNRLNPNRRTADIDLNTPNHQSLEKIEKTLKQWASRPRRLKDGMVASVKLRNGASVKLDFLQCPNIEGAHRATPAPRETREDSSHNQDETDTDNDAFPEREMVAVIAKLAKQAKIAVLVVGGLALHKLFPARRTLDMDVHVNSHHDLDKCQKVFKHWGSKHRILKDGLVASVRLDSGRNTKMDMKIRGFVDQNVSRGTVSFERRRNSSNTRSEQREAEVGRREKLGVTDGT